MPRACRQPRLYPLLFSFRAGFFRSGYVRKKTETLPPRWRPNESRIFKTLLSARGLPRAFRILGGVGEASALR